MPLYQTTGLNATEVKRAVIVLPGKLRDCWYYWNSMNNALYIAAEKDSGIKRSEVSIMGPCYFTEQDRDAGSARDDVLLWGDTTWASGFYNTGPDSIKKYSAFDVLDELVAYYMDRTNFPNLNTVVVGGHSLGAQMAQHYAVLRKVTKNDDRLHFWIANPGSICWLTKDRPAPNASCDGVDEYKYGLAGNFPGYATGDLGRKALVSRYRGRTINYAWGLKDNGPGDTRCEAVTQGSTHLERGQNFVAMLKAHYNEGMMNSDGGIDKLFRLNYNGTSA
ncbi:hypothetical protein BDZ89DRAFT_817906 [Hymenopellis radicata]|nr:hypothetical protein BDZ89DRAFT_817906 [Hymenopellis radicata]